MLAKSQRKGYNGEMWPFNKKLTIYDLMKAGAEAYRKGLAMSGTRPIQREIMWKCFHCDRSIMTDEAYVEIMHYRPHPHKTTQKHFHTSCFEEIAGKEYL